MHSPPNNSEEGSLDRATDPVSPPETVAEHSSLEWILRPLRPWLNDSEVTEICINRPHEAYIETLKGWERCSLPFADFAWCLRLAKLVANYTSQRIAEDSPLLSASLPTGARLHVVIPPATNPDCVAIAIRRPSAQVWSIDELASKGALRFAKRAGHGLDATEVDLQRLLKAGEYLAFLRLAVRSRKNIVVSGPTGSGKTTWTKALIQEIPTHERLITIEDARELTLTQHPNHVQLFYSKNNQGLARVTPQQLLESCLRMRPDRVLLAELRGAEAFEFLRNVNSGHPGSITSVHAASAELAFEQLMLLIKHAPGGQALAREDILNLLYILVDVVIQFEVHAHERLVKEIWYAPERKHRALANRG
jgi:type IV secretion system protein VirB11